MSEHTAIRCADIAKEARQHENIALILAVAACLAPCSRTGASAYLCRSAPRNRRGRTEPDHRTAQCLALRRAVFVQRRDGFRQEFECAARSGRVAGGRPDRPRFARRSTITTRRSPTTAKPSRSTSRAHHRRLQGRPAAADLRGQAVRGDAAQGQACPSASTTRRMYTAIDFPTDEDLVPVGDQLEGLRAQGRAARSGRGAGSRTRRP